MIARITRRYTGPTTVLVPLALFAMLLAPRPAQAQPLADRVPADTVVYFGWEGSDGLATAYAQSRLKAVVDSTDASQIIDDFLPRLVERAAKEDRQVGEVAKLITGLAKPMWQHPTAFAFGGIDWNAGADAMPRLMLLCQAGPDAADLQGKIEGVLKDGPPEMKEHLKVYRGGDLVAVYVGYKDLKDVLGDKSKGNSLEASANFKSAMSQVGKNPALALYVDMEKVFDLIDKGVAREGDPQAKENWPKVKRAAGLDGIKRIAATSGFDGKEWSDQVFIAAPEPRKGLLKLGESTPVSDGALASIPKTATLAGVVKFDAAKLFDIVREIAFEVEPRSKEEIEGGLQQIKEFLKIDVEKDLLQALGDEWVYYTDPNVGGRGMLGFVMVNRLRDEKKATTSLALIETFANAQIAEQMKNEQMKIAFYQAKYGDLIIHYLGTPIVSPAWAIKDGNLYIALFPQMVSAAARHVSGKGESIVANKDFMALRERMGNPKNAIGFSFMNLPQTAPDAYAQWVMVSRLSGFADMFGVQSPTMLLPPIDKLIPQLTPAGEVVLVDKDGWHVRSVSPFPGATILASDPLASMMTMQPLMLMGMWSGVRQARAGEAREAEAVRRIEAEPAPAPKLPPEPKFGPNDPTAPPPVAPPPPAPRQR